MPALFDPTLKQAILDEVVIDLQGRSKSVEYRNDPVRWAQDVLGVTLWSKQKEILESLVANKKTAVKSCHSIGKFHPVSVELPTPQGMRRLGDIRVGDFVFDANGNPTEVTYVTPDQYDTTYRVVFNDGAEVLAGGPHLWQVQDLNRRKRGVTDWRDHWDNTDTYTTEELLAKGLKTGGNQYRWRVPTAKPFQMPDADLPLDPYLYGLWLGDGGATTDILSGNDNTKAFYRDVLDAAGYVGGSYHDLRSSGVAFRAPGLHNDLQTAGLWNKDGIDKRYMWASENQRKALLAGLMDSDGFAMPTGSGFDTTNQALAHAVAQLIRSLGVKVHVRDGVAAYTLDGKRHVTGTRYRLAFSPSFNPGRNRHVWNAPKTSKTTLRTIVAIEEVANEEPSRCIVVDNPDHLYLVTDHFIPTHNTFTSAIAVCWWISTRPNSMVRSTAPTSYQVHELLWEEIRKMHARSGLIGDVNLKDEWKRPLYGATALVGSGKKPSDTNIHAFQGVHRPDGVLSVLDEAGGVPQNLYTAADAISTGKEDRVLAVGNPDDPDTEFGEVFRRGGSIWNLITVSAYDTPNFTGEPVPEIVSRGLIQPEWVEQRKAEWGEDSSRFKSKILAEFPDQSDDAFFKQSVIDKAYDTEITGELDMPGCFGIDVASSGNDYSVVALNRGGKIRIVDSWNHGDIVTSIDRIHALSLQNGITELRIDAVGYGEAVVQQIMKDERFVGYTIISVKGSYSAQDKAAHLNARAEQYDNLRKKMLQGKIDLDRTDTKVSDQLLAIKGFLTARSQIQIESKEDMRARGVKSPDELDAIVYAAADFSHLFKDTLPTGTKVFQELDDILAGSDGVLDLMLQF